MSDQVDCYFKLPIKYVQLNEHHLKSPACPLVQNVNMPLSPIIENCGPITASSLPQQALNEQANDLTSSNGSVFKRMFKRSKSITRQRNGSFYKSDENAESNSKSTNQNNVSISKPAVRNLISFDLTYDQPDLVTSDFSIESFSRWQSICRPNLPEEK